MHETNAEFEPRESEMNLNIWAFGLIFIVFGVIAILYYLRYVRFVLKYSDEALKMVLFFGNLSNFVSVCVCTRAYIIQNGFPPK